jgi:hypothetical protein
MSSLIQTPVHTFLSSVVDAACPSPDLSNTEAAHLPYVYSTTVDGPEAAAVMQDARRLGLTALWACEFVATDREIPAVQVAEWLLMPASSMARDAVRLYLCGVNTEGTEEEAFARKQDEMLGTLHMVERLLSGLHIHERVSFEPLTDNVIMIGQRLRMTKEASGWKFEAIDLGE